MLPHELRLSVYDVDGALMACGCTQAAAVALFFVNVNDLSQHMNVVLLFSKRPYNSSICPN